MFTRRSRKLSVEFSMASMTDMIFLLLIFFMITSTAVLPNAIKVLLPKGTQQTSVKPLAKVIIDKQLRYYVAYGKQKERRISTKEIVPFLQESYRKNNEMYIALYADETIPYAEVVKILDIVNQNRFKMILVTRSPNK